jgi:hypothetical protein
MKLLNDESRSSNSSKLAILFIVVKVFTMMLYCFGKESRTCIVTSVILIK